MLMATHACMKFKLKLSDSKWNDKQIDVKILKFSKE